MRRACVIGITVAGLIAGAMVHAQPPRSTEVRMKAAQQKAEVEGDLVVLGQEPDLEAERPAHLLLPGEMVEHELVRERGTDACGSGGRHGLGAPCCVPDQEGNRPRCQPSARPRARFVSTWHAGRGKLVHRGTRVRMRDRQAQGVGRVLREVVQLARRHAHPEETRRELGQLMRLVDHDKPFEGIERRAGLLQSREADGILEIEVVR